MRLYFFNLTSYPTIETATDQLYSKESRTSATSATSLYCSSCYNYYKLEDRAYDVELSGDIVKTSGRTRTIVPNGVCAAAAMASAKPIRHEDFRAEEFIRLPGSTEFVDYFINKDSGECIVQIYTEIRYSPKILNTCERWQSRPCRVHNNIEVQTRKPLLLSVPFRPLRHFTRDGKHPHHERRPEHRPEPVLPPPILHRLRVTCFGG